jgi:hypothetical protein
MEHPNFVARNLKNFGIGCIALIIVQFFSAVVIPQVSASDKYGLPKPRADNLLLPDAA